MVKLKECENLLKNGFSLITVQNNKTPNYSWKKQQTTPLTFKEFKKRYNYKGGYFYKDASGNEVELKPTENAGIVTGYGDLEVIDIDCKILSSASEIDDFQKEFFELLEDNIDDFYNKFTITRTRNKGFHILYKNKNVAGNVKIAKLKGHNAALIETRGKGGYVFIYHSFFDEKYYTDIKYVSDEDREILWSCCRTYNYVDEQPEEKSKNNLNQNSDLTPWDDFNTQNQVLDVVGSEFNIVRNLKDKYLIKRHGAESPHSGYIYKDNDIMYLFSTGTQYPHEKALTAFGCYAYRDHDGDFKKAASQAYKDGYGQRHKKEPPKQLTEPPKIKEINFPVDIFPKFISNYILECNKTLDSITDYMGSAMLWMTSVIIGNALEVEIKRGWKEKPILWISNVGKAGIGKTPSVKNITYPLQKVNSQQIKNYIKDSKKFEEFDKLSKEEKKKTVEVKKPVKAQFIANDITIEALVDLHQESKNSVGVFKDELAGWLKDMNKYREGSDLEFWLSSWSNESVNVNRMTRVGSFIESPFMPVLGGIQPNILNGFFTSENKSNGFIDRLLITYPEASVEDFNDKEMNAEALQWYGDTIHNFYYHFKNKFAKQDEDGEIITRTSQLSSGAKKVWKDTFNEYSKVQNGDFENEYLKSMYPKQKSYIPRFALIIHVLDCYISEKEQAEYLLISEDAMLKAVKLSAYFIQMAKKVKIKGKVSNEMIQSINQKNVLSDYEKVEKVYQKNPKFNKAELSELLGISRQTIYNYLKEIKKQE